MLESKIIEYRIVKCDYQFTLPKKTGEVEPVKGYYLQVLNKGLLKDKWVDYNSINTYVWHERKFFRSEAAIDAFVKANCKYNPADTKFIKHQTIEIL